MLLFAPTTDRPFGDAVARELDIELAEHEERDFEDGEHKMRPLTCVREEDVHVVQSLYGDEKQTVNDKLCRLLFFLGALRDAGAKRVTAVIPYLCYTRKDRKTKTRDPITTRYVAQLLECVGADRVVTMDVHNLAAFQNAFRIQTVHLEATSAFVAHFANQSPRQGFTVVSPDTGGVKRAEKFRQALRGQLGCDVPLALMEKYRSEGIVSGTMFAGDVEGRLAIVLDDLISTGGTLVRAARAYQDRGAVAVHAATNGEANEMIIIVDDDPVYIAWLHRHPSGFVLDARRKPTARSTVLHRAICSLLRGRNKRRRWTTGKKVKACSADADKDRSRYYCRICVVATVARRWTINNPIPIRPRSGERSYDTYLSNDPKLVAWAIDQTGQEPALCDACSPLSEPVAKELAGHADAEPATHLRDSEGHMKALDCRAVAGKFEDAEQTQQTESADRTQVNARPDVKRQDCDNVNDPEEAEYVPASRGRDIDTQEILDAKDDYAEYLETSQPQLCRFGERRQRLN